MGAHSAAELTTRAFSSIDTAAEAGHEGAGELRSFFVGQVVGAFRELRGAGEITRSMARDCEARIAALSRLVVTDAADRRSARPGDLSDAG